MRRGGGVLRRPSAVLGNARRGDRVPRKAGAPARCIIRLAQQAPVGSMPVREATGDFIGLVSSLKNMLLSFSRPRFGNRHRAKFDRTCGRAPRTLRL
jgi:hypothetical protein